MKREWTIPTVDEDGFADYEGVYNALNELATILLRLGGVGGIAPHRVETDHGYVVDRVLFSYDSYAPGLNRRQAEARAKEEPEAEAPEAEVVELAAVGESSNGTDDSTA